MYQNSADAARDQTLADMGLPELAYVENKNGIYGVTPIVAVKRGESGYYPIHTQATADEMNAAAGVTYAQVEAMHAGSMFGWDCKGANPATWAAMDTPKAKASES